MPSAGSQAGPLVTTPMLPPKPTTMFRNSVRALDPRALTLMLPTALQVDTSDAFLVIRTVSEPGSGATATAQEISPTAKAIGTTTIRLSSMAYLSNQSRNLSKEYPNRVGRGLGSSLQQEVRPFKVDDPSCLRVSQIELAGAAWDEAVFRGA